jgi:nitrite reductase/ring-hydroxylating ferredoxin subunit
MSDPTHQSVAPDDDWTEVGVSDEFPEGSGWPVSACGTTIAIIRFEGRLFGLHDQCTHGAAQLSSGWVEDGWVECPLHQGRFELATGKPLCEPVTEAVRCYETQETDGRVWVRCRPGT